jgi:hypothetical protein
MGVNNGFGVVHNGYDACATDMMRCATDMMLYTTVMMRYATAMMLAQWLTLFSSINSAYIRQVGGFHTISVYHR